MRKRHLVIVPIIVVVLMAFGQCDKYRKAGQMARDFAAGVSAFQDGEIVFHQQGKIDDAEHTKIQQVILQVATDGKALDRAINQVHSAPEARSALDAALLNVQTGLSDGVFQIKNPEAKASLQTSIVLLKSILDNIKAIGG